MRFHLVEKIRLRLKRYFKIIKSDVLSLYEEDLIGTKFRIVANLPYNISTLLITKWLKKISVEKIKTGRKN